MWLLAVLAILYAVFVHWLSIYITLICLLVYMLSYWDGKEYTGERHWPGFRRCFGLWRWLTPVSYQIINEADLAAITHETPRLYVLLPGDTPMSSVWGIGLHGGALAPRISDRLHYVVPPLFMWIPVLRDVLLWSGAVTYHPRKRPLTDVLLDLLLSNRSVCYSPSHFANIAQPEVLLSVVEPSDAIRDVEMQTMTSSVAADQPSSSSDKIVTPCLTDAMFDFARTNNLQLVPIVVRGERRRYAILESPTLSRIQRFTFRHVGYPFPFCFVWRFWSRVRPPMLHMQFGNIIHCSTRYTQASQVRDVFTQNVGALTCVEFGDDELHLM